MPLHDLRSFLDESDKLGELKVIRGADPHLEIGAISELCLDQDGPALLFDDIPGYPAGYRVAVNVTSSKRRALLALGMDTEMPEEEVPSKFQKIYDAYKQVPPKYVETGPVMENVQTGDDVDLLQFPVPFWHELDGGKYIGTGLGVIQRDPDTGEVNVGAYRVQLQNRNTLTIFSEPDSDGRGIMEKHWSRGESCPVAITFGPEPLLFLSACSTTGSPRRWKEEYEYTGYLAGEPVPVIKGPVTGLPISAGSEIVIEGEIPPPDKESMVEGPFAEWTGYYEFSSTPEPVIHVKALYYRNDPILYGAPPFKHDKHYVFPIQIRSAGLISKFQQMEIPVRRIWDFRPLGATVFAIEQQAPDDVTRLMDELEKTHVMSRMMIVVDHDVDIKNPMDVFWAMGTRFDPEQARTSIVDSRWLLDPMRPIADRESRRALPYKRLIINGCRPFDRLNDFPPVNRFSEERRKETWEKWNMADWAIPTPTE